MIKHKYHLHIMLDDESNDKLQDLCQQSGLTQSILIRKLIAQTEIKGCNPKEIQRLYREMNHVGNNINQIARAVNAGFATDEDVKQSLYFLEKIYDLVYKVANG